MGNVDFPGLGYISNKIPSPVSDFISVSSRRRNLRNVGCSVTPKYFPIDWDTMLSRSGVGQDFVLLGNKRHKKREDFFQFIMKLHTFVRKFVESTDLQRGRDLPWVSVRKYSHWVLTYRTWIQVAYWTHRLTHIAPNTLPGRLYKIKTFWDIRWLPIFLE